MSTDVENKETNERKMIREGRMIILISKENEVNKFYVMLGTNMS